MIGVILAGGEGKRLRPYTSLIPKPLVPIGGKPVMEHTINRLREAGITSIYISTCYKSEQIQKYFQNGSRLGVEITYLVETEPLGTAGALFKEPIFQKETSIVISGDSFSTIDIKDMIDYHRNQNALVTLAIKKMNDLRQFGVCVVNENQQIKKFEEKPELPKETEGYVNTGMYILDPKVFLKHNLSGPVDFATDLFPKIIERNEAIYGYITSEYWRDIGTHEEYEKTVKEHSNAIVHPSNRFVSRMVVDCPSHVRRTVLELLIHSTPIEKLEILHGIKINHQDDCYTVIKNHSPSSVVIYSYSMKRSLSREYANYYYQKIQKWQKVAQ